MGRILTILAGVAALLVLFNPGCHTPVKGDRIINDFETDADLDGLSWKCRTLLALSPEHVSHGGHSLKITCYPSMYPGTSIKHVPKDWTGYDALAIDIVNPEPRDDLRLAVRIDDKTDSPDYNDRYNHGITLKPGMNHVRLPMESLKTPQGRPLDLKHIHALLFFMVNPREPRVLFMDHLRLEERTTGS